MAGLAGVHDRESLRGRISVAVHLAIGNAPTLAHRALQQIASVADSGDDELVALYFQARAITYIKERAIVEGFETFERALAAAREDGEPGLCARILINYGTAAVQDGSAALAIVCLEEALEKAEGLATVKPFALVSLAEAFLAAGNFRRAAELLHELHAIRNGDSVTPLVAAAVGIPLGMMLDDQPLLEQSYDPSLLDLAFARREQWLLGPLVESFCALYEYQGRHEEHNALLERALESVSVLDNSLLLGIRAARLGQASQLARLSALMAQQCGLNSELLRAYQDLFESFIAGRRQMPVRAAKLARQAAGEFARGRRPLMQALALDAAGLPNEAHSLRARSGALVDAMRPVWRGAPIHKRLATLLTARESEVARLAARGATNRTIALTLGLSERTVHHHCEAIFSKLGIRSRWQLTPVLGQGAAQKSTPVGR